MADDDATNLVDGDDTVVDDTTVADDTGVDQQFDDEGNPIPEEPDDEEVEIDDELKVKVPKAQAQKVKDALLRQADYTRKTQDVSERSKALDARETAFNQVSNAEITALATVRSIDAQLGEYQRIDWQAWNDQAAGNPQEQSRVTAAWMEFQQLEKARGNAAGQFVNLREQRALETQQAIAKRTEETQAVLAKDIPGWNEEARVKLTNFAVETYGFSADEASGTKIDPRIAKVLSDAQKWRNHSKTVNRVTATQKQQEVTPAATVVGKSAPVAPLSDKAPTDAWMKARNKQEAARRRK